MAGSSSADGPGLAARYRLVMEPRALQLFRRGFRRLNRGMELLWRLGLGGFADVWPSGFGRLLVIEHTGRKSGARRRTPVNYTVAGDDLYCVAAFGERTDWYRNLLSTPDTAVWLPDGRWEARVTDASDRPDRIDLMRRVLIDSGFAARLFGLNPLRINDDDLAEATATYRLMRIEPIRRQDSPDGPNDLAWVWVPIAAALSILLLLRRSTCRSCR